MDVTESLPSDPDFLPSDPDFPSSDPDFPSSVPDSRPSDPDSPPSDPDSPPSDPDSPPSDPDSPPSDPPSPPSDPDSPPSDPDSPHSPPSDPDSPPSDPESLPSDSESLHSGEEPEAAAQNRVKQNNLLLLALKLKHGLTSDAVEDISKLVNYVSQGENVARSKYLLDKEFSSATIEACEFHHICSQCRSYIGLSVNGKLNCPNVDCNNSEPVHFHHNSFFMYLPVKRQLIDLLENHDMASKIDKCNRIPNDTICDIFDGECYMRSMPVSDKDNLSLTFSCDGVPIFKSSTCSIWPILCTVNELPASLRKKHVLLVSLWFGSDKPNMHVYFEPFVKETSDLYSNGFNWTDPNNKRVVHTKLQVLVGVCDTVARPLLQNFKQFNGKHGCGYCLDEGVLVAKGDGHTRAYPYEVDSELRTEEATNDWVERASASNSEILGVKGVSLLSLLPGFNIIDGLVPDYMHCVILGAARQIVYLWFDTQNHKEEFYLGKAIKNIDAELLSIRPTCNISRLPRSLTMRKFWKAHEWYAWLFFYSLPILKSYLPVKFYRHWALLVEGVSILLSSSITRASLNHSELILTQFVFEMQNLYGLNHCSFNIHLCLHVAKSVKDWGPLWCHSAFVFEGYNAQLIEMFKGTQAVPLQICKTFLLRRAIPSLAQNLKSTNRCSVKYNTLLSSFSSKNDKIAHAATVNRITLLGKAKFRRLRDADRLPMLNVSRDIDLSSFVKYYNRIVIEGELVHTYNYCRNLKRNSFTVELLDGQIFAVDDFIVVNLHDSDVCCATGHFLEPVVQRLVTNDAQPIYLKHLVSVKKRFDRTVAIRADDIKSKCVVVPLSQNCNVLVVCKQLNNIEYCA